MKQYRLLRKEYHTPGCITSSKYFIQVKTLWWWSYVYFLQAKDAGNNTISIEEEQCIYYSKENADIYMETFILQPFKKVFRGNTIIKVKGFRNNKPLYVNLNRYTHKIGPKKLYMEYSVSLHGLQHIINRRLKYV